MLINLDHFNKLWGKQCQKVFENTTKGDHLGGNILHPDLPSDWFNGDSIVSLQPEHCQKRS